MPVFLYTLSLVFNFSLHCYSWLRRAVLLFFLLVLLQKILHFIFNGLGFFIYSIVLAISMLFSCRNPLFPRCLTGNFTVTKRSPPSFFKVWMLLQELNISQSFLRKYSIVILNVQIECWGPGRGGNLSEVRRASCDTSLPVNKCPVCGLYVLFSQNFISAKRVLIESWILASFFEGHFVFFEVLSTLQSTAFVFSHTTYGMSYIWGYYFH